MKSQHNTKQLSSWPFVLALCLLIVIGTLIVKLWPRTVPFDQCSPLYEHYADVEGVDASFIKDFRVNDTVFVDVTLLEAKDSAGWAMLKHDFSVPELNDEWQAYIDAGEDLIFSQILTPSHYPISVLSDTILFDILATSYYSHTLVIFHGKNEKDIRPVFRHNFQESFN